MPIIPRNFINELLARTDIVEIIDARVSLRKKGANYTACCPFHNEKTPSFTVSQSKQFYHCFGCGVNGNAISFLMEFDRLSFVETVEYLAGQLSLEIPREIKSQTTALTQKPDLYDVMEKVTQYYQKQLREHPEAIDYLKQRGLTGKIAKDFRIGYAPQAWDNLTRHISATADLLSNGLIIQKTQGNTYYDRFRDRVIFPIRDRRGRVIAFGGRIIGTGDPKYMNSPETPIFHKGNELYGIYEALQAERNLTKVLVVEGYMDVVALAQQGIHNVVATLGTATTPDHIQRLFRLTQEIIFCFDGDRAGQAAAFKALETALPLLQDGNQIRFLILPQGEDPDTLIRKEGKEKFLLRIEASQSLADFLFFSASQSIDISTEAGKARFVKQLVPLINKLPANIFQQLLFDRLADIVRMDVAALKNITKTQPKSEKIIAQQKVNPRRSVLRMAIALLIQHPNLISSLPENISFENFVLPSIGILKEIVDILKNSTDINTGTLLEYWRDRPESKTLNQLATLEITIPEDAMENEFLGIIARLYELNRDQQIEILLQKSKVENLSMEEKKMLQLLITESKS